MWQEDGAPVEHDVSRYEARVVQMRRVPRPVYARARLRRRRHTTRREAHPMNPTTPLLGPPCIFCGTEETTAITPHLSTTDRMYECSLCFRRFAARRNVTPAAQD